MKKIPIYLLKTIAGLIGLVVFLALVVWFFPEIIVNDKTVKWLAHKQTAFQFEPSFPQEFEFDIRNSNVFNQKIRLQASHFCIRAADQSLHACFEKLDLTTILNFKNFKLGFDSIGPAIVETSTVEFKSIEKKETKPEKTNGKNPFDLPWLSENFNLEEIRIDMPIIDVISGKTQMKIAFQAKGNRDSKDVYQLTAEAKATSNQEPKSIAVNLQTEITRDMHIDGTLKAQVGLDTKKPNIVLDSKIKGDLISSRGELNGRLRLSHVTEFIPLIEVRDFKIIKTDKITAEGNFDIEFLLGYLDNPRKSALPPPKFKTKFSGAVQAEQSGNEPIKFSLEINPLEQYGIVTQAKAKGAYVTKKSRLDLDSLSLSVKIADFKKTVRGLRRTQMAVPSPINEMGGSLDIEIGAEKLEKSKDGSFTIPVQFKSDLQSTKQSLITNTKGSLWIQTAPFEGKLKLNVELQKIKLQMPDFDPISKIPTVVGDSRFVKRKEDIKESELFTNNSESAPIADSAFTTEIHIQTTDNPIKIYYKHFNPSATFRIETNIGGKNPGFKIKVNSFEVNYLKRKARLERLNISDDPETDSILLDGRISMKKADYNLYADIHMESKNTSIALTSDPPLTEDDIISLILFNELATNLDSTSTDSVENTQAALTKRSIGFFSFFVLSSTPVESVNYDPTTNEYSARVKLPGGFTGTVGSDWDKSQEVGLRRRLGGNWVISATTGTDSEGNSRQESMIEWYHRY